jgi:pimeloyl-ACP methyl ester carboxylesterase
MTIVRSRGFEIAYEATGTGPAVVLLPGVMMPRARWWHAGYVEALAGRHTVITIDPLGLGESSQALDPAAYRADLLASDTIAVLDQEGVEQAVLWGYSRGAGLASDVAALFPDRVRGLIAGGATVLIPRSALPPDPAGVAALRAGDWDGYWERFPMPLPSEVKADFERWNDPMVAAALVEGTTGDIDRSGLSCPVLLYVGGGEWFWEVVRDEANQLGARFERIGELGHAETFLARDTVVPLVDDFVGSIGAR